MISSGTATALGVPVIDVIGFALGAAQQILATVLTNALAGRYAARKREIQREAMQRVEAQPGLSRADMDVLTARIVSEVRYLVNEHPDLEWRMNAVRVVPPVPSATPAQPNATNALLRERLERLNRIAKARWEHVRDESESPTPPALSPKPAALERPTIADSPTGAQIVAIRDYGVDPTSYWQQRLEGMRANVQADQRRRATGEIPAPRAGNLHEGDPATSLPESPPAT